MPHPVDEVPSTYFAPPERSSEPELSEQRRVFLNDVIAPALLSAMPDLAVILNENRQAIAANDLLLKHLGVDDAGDLLGLRPGEAVGCVNAAIGPNGCGTAEGCRECGAVNAILDCLERGGTFVRECRIRTSGTADGGALDLRVQAALLEIERQRVVLLGLRDISAEKRRAVLERVFFHDVLNTAGGLQGLAEILMSARDSQEADELKHDVYRLSQAIVDEIQSHRQLMAAEEGTLEVAQHAVVAGEIVDEVVALYRNHHVARQRQLRVEGSGEAVVATDHHLLRRVLGNLVKNALEATPRGGTVTIRTSQNDDGGVLFEVHNPTVMPDEVRLQVFQRSFSTKEGSGRGVGTYSIKLFAEGYLRGQVDFTSVEPEGTWFRVLLPPFPPNVP